MWSLGVEEQFYLFWPVVIAFYRKYIPSIVAVIIVLCILTSIILPGIAIPYHGKIIPLDTYSFLNRWFLPAVAPIMFGALFSYLLIRHEQVWKFYFFKKHFLLFVAMLLFFLPAYAPVMLFRFPYGLQLLQMAGIAVLITWIFFNQNSLLTRCLEWKPVSYTGKISYGLYVYHGLFIRTGHGSLYMQQYPLNVFLTAGTAVLSYEFYEKRVLKLKRKFSSAPLRVSHLKSKIV
jgi:peptidoglycan/LPS O-acetylase OafA/YrhL